MYLLLCQMSLTFVIFRSSLVLYLLLKQQKIIQKRLSDLDNFKKLGRYIDTLSLLIWR